MSKRIFQIQLEKLMKAKGVNQEDIASVVGISQSAVSRWFNGSVPGSNRLAILADYFNVTTDELLTGREAFQGITHAVNAAKDFEGTPEEKQLRFERVAAGLYPPSLSAKFERLAFLEKENKRLRAALEQFRKKIDKLLEN